MIAYYRNNEQKCREIFSAVTYIKIILSIVFGGVFWGICNVIAAWKEDIFLFMLFYGAYCINAFLPDFVYRGKECMQIVTIRTIAIKVFFVSLIFIFLKDMTDLLLYPIALLLGNVMAVLLSFIHIYREYNIKLCKVTVNEVKVIIIKTIPFFISRLASTFYQAATMLIIGTIYVNQSIVGFYSAADKLMAATKSASSPIADSLYPYMIKNKDFSLIKKICILVIPIIGVCGVVCMVFAEQVCVLLFGSEYIQAANILRCLIPAMMVILPTYIVCFPVLVPMGLEKYANFSNVLGAILQVCFIAVLFITDTMSVYSICICGSISEIVVFLFRSMIALKFRNRK